MRSGGPRLLCSPYFVLALFVLILFVTMKFYSVSTENENLLMRIEVIQNQMKMTGTNLKNLDASLNQKTEALQECSNQRIDAVERARKTEAEMQQKEEIISRLKDEVGNKQRTIEKLQSENVNMYVANDSITDAIQKLNEELDYHKIKNERLEKSVIECDANAAKAAALEEEMKTLKAEVANLRHEEVDGKEKISIHGQESQDVDGGRHHLHDGQLSDVDPDAVHIRQPALEGNRYHQDEKGNYLPILPRGDPNGPRPKPRFSVIDLTKNTSTNAGSAHAATNQTSVTTNATKMMNIRLSPTTPSKTVVTKNQTQPAKKMETGHKADGSGTKLKPITAVSADEANGESDLRDKAEDLENEMDGKKETEANEKSQQGDIDIEETVGQSSKDDPLSLNNEEKSYQDPDGPPDDEGDEVQQAGGVVAKHQQVKIE